MVPYLYNNLFNIIKKTINLTIKPDISIKCINGANLKNVGLSNKDNFIKSTDMNVGFSTTATMAELKKDLVMKKKKKKKCRYFF